MLSTDLNANMLAAQFAKRKRVQIPNALEPGSAEAIADVLLGATKWALVFNRGSQNVTLTQEEIAGLGKVGMAKLMQECLQNAQTDFQYIYSSYPIVDAILAKRDVGHPLHAVLEQINAAPFRAFVEHVTGVSGLVKADGQATLYTRGNFLTFHNDFDRRDTRRIAYVLGFTKNWKSDWGGLLEFYDDQGNVELGLVPRFNALTLFQVPTNHAVTFVPPFVAEGRYSITGWFSIA